MEWLSREIEAILTEYTGRWGIVVENLTSGERMAVNPDMVFPAASTVKILIMYEIMRQAAAGTVDLDAPLVVTEEGKAGGAGILKELRAGLALTVRELVTLMMIVSDNTATNMLIDLVGMEAINHASRDLGLKTTVLRRRMMDFAAARAGRENYTSALDLAHLLAAVYHGKELPPAYRLAMLDILQRQQFRDKLPFYLPEETVIAHKTGTLPGFEHDAGILFLPGGPYVVCVLTGDLAANYQGVQLVAAIGKKVYERFAAAMHTD